MSTHHRSFILALLLPAFVLVSAFAVVQAQNAKSPAVKQTRWSDPASWPDRKVPRAGDKVTIAAGGLCTSSVPFLILVEYGGLIP